MTTRAAPPTAFLLLCCVLAASCSSREDRPGGSDAGARDGAPPPSDAGDPGTSTTLRLRVVDTVTGAPVEGAHVAVDVGTTRVEADASATGEVTLVVPRTDVADVTVAKERYTVSSWLGAAVTDLGSDGAADEIALVTLRPATPDVRTIVSATGVPAGGRWCTSLGEFFAWCTTTAEIDTAVAAAAVTDRLTAFAIDASENVVDYAEVAVTMVGDTRTATFAFDTTPEVADVARDLRIVLPSDPESTWRTSDIMSSSLPIVVTVTTGDYLLRGLATGLTRAADGGSYTARVHVFARPGDDLVHAFALYTAPDGDAWATRWFAAEPTAPSYALLDMPRITGRAADGVYTLPFTWTVPTGAEERFDVVLLNNAGVRTWVLRTAAHADVRFPALPSGYDPTVSFPFEGANGRARVIAYVGRPPNARTAPAGTEPYRVDAQAAAGPTVGIRF